jgi:hypothetical protein
MTTYGIISDGENSEVKRTFKSVSIIVLKLILLTLLLTGLFITTTSMLEAGRKAMPLETKPRISTPIPERVYDISWYDPDYWEGAPYATDEKFVWNAPEMFVTYYMSFHLNKSGYALDALMNIFSAPNDDNNFTFTILGSNKVGEAYWPDGENELYFGWCLATNESGWQQMNESSDPYMDNSETTDNWWFLGITMESGTYTAGTKPGLRVQDTTLRCNYSYMLYDGELLEYPPYRDWLVNLTVGEYPNDEERGLLGDDDDDAADDDDDDDDDDSDSDSETQEEDEKLNPFSEYQALIVAAIGTITAAITGIIKLIQKKLKDKKKFSWFKF